MKTAKNAFLLSFLMFLSLYAPKQGLPESLRVCRIFVKATAPEFGDDQIDYVDLCIERVEQLDQGQAYIRRFLKNFSDFSKKDTREFVNFLSPQDGFRSNFWEMLQGAPNVFLQAILASYNETIYADQLVKLSKRYLQALVALTEDLQVFVEWVPEPGCFERFFNKLGCLCCFTACCAGAESPESQMMQHLASKKVYHDQVITLSQQIGQLLCECRRQLKALSPVTYSREIDLEFFAVQIKALCAQED